MNEDQLRDALKNAYDVHEPDADTQGRIRHRVKHRKRNRRWNITWIDVVRSSALILVAFLTYPVVKSNLITLAIAREMTGHVDFSASIAFRARSLSAGEHLRSDPIYVSVYHDTVIVRTHPDAIDFDLYSHGRLAQYFGEDRQVVLRSGEHSIGLLEIPKKVSAILGKPRFSSVIRSQGQVNFEGRLLNQVTLVPDSALGQITVASDPDSGLPIYMVLDGYIRPGLTTTIRYDYDAEKAHHRVMTDAEKVQTSIQQHQVIDLSTGKASVSQLLVKRPISITETGRDRLTLWKVEQSNGGEIFVLYSMKGYHNTDDFQSPILRLRDSNGVEWLSDIVDFTGSELTLNGEHAKCQVFFHPEASTGLPGVEFLVKIDDWEFLPASSSISTTGQLKTIADTRPIPLHTRVPSWIYFAKNTYAPSWTVLDGLRLRFQNALNQRRYQQAQSLGQRLEAIYPDVMEGFFFDKVKLYLGLYHAFRATNDVPEAVAYLRKAIEHQAESSLDFSVSQDIDSARKIEGL